MMKSVIKFLTSWVLVLFCSTCYAQLAVEISGMGSSRYPVAIPLFENEGALGNSISDIVRNDLKLSGFFQLVNMGLTSLPEGAQPDFVDLQGRGAFSALAASIRPVEGGQYEVRIRLFDVQKQADMGGMAYRMSANQYRVIAHRISDFIYFKITGLQGYFTSRLAYVAKSGGDYLLQISDMDGDNPQTALKSREPIISPSWSPNGQQVAYVSFENKKPIVYIHDLPTGRRWVVANFKGSNSAPAWSPDGRQLAVVLTKDTGLSQIYLINSDGSNLRRLSHSFGIDTEPRWSADGQSIYFTSDRGGSPQIYKMSVGGGNVQRVTFEGSYNVSPRVSPDGKGLAYITRQNGKLQLAFMNLATHQTLVLSQSQRAESPSFSPNNIMLVYASREGGRNFLEMISSDGTIRQRLPISAANVREPTWGPSPYKQQ